jgi:hypothetical protein
LFPLSVPDCGNRRPFDDDDDDFVWFLVDDDFSSFPALFIAEGGFVLTVDGRGLGML